MREDLSQVATAEGYLFQWCNCGVFYQKRSRVATSTRSLKLLGLGYPRVCSNVATKLIVSGDGGGELMCRHPTSYHRGRRKSAVQR